jgi:hypothetical protein
VGRIPAAALFVCLFVVVSVRRRRRRRRRKKKGRNTLQGFRV